MVTSGDFQGEVGNFELQLTSEGDIFRTGGSSEMALSGGAYQEENVFGMKVVHRCGLE